MRLTLKGSLGGSTINKLLLIVTAVILLASISGAMISFLLPTEIEESLELVTYQHEGKFDYIAYLGPSYLFGPEPQEPPPPPPPPPPPLPNPKYPAEIIDSIDMSFTYKATISTSQQVEINAVLENPDIWQKEITLVPETTQNGDFTIGFPLDIDEINELFDTIDEEIKITSSSRNVTIIANVVSFVEVFTQRLPIKLGKLIEVDSNLKLTNLGATGQFDYSVHLKENSLFDTKTLKPPPPVTPPPPPPPPPPPLPPKSVGPGGLLFSKLLDRMDVTFSYKFKSDKPVRQVIHEVEINAVLENPEVWSKTFALVPHTNKSGDFAITFPLDINQILEMLEAIRSETEVFAESYNLTITADVHTVAETEFGPLNETFSQTMSSTLGEGTLEWSEELVSTKSGSIEASRMIPNKLVGVSVSGARILFPALTAIFLGFSLYLLILHMKSKPVKLPYIEKEALRVRKKYGGRMAEATSQTPLKGEKIIFLGSMEDLIKVADELDKPIIHQPPRTSKERHAYYVFDGTTRYQYVVIAGTNE